MYKAKGYNISHASYHVKMWSFYRFHPKVGVRTVQKNLFEKRNAIKFRHAVSIGILL